MRHVRSQQDCAFESLLGKLQGLQLACSGCSKKPAGASLAVHRTFGGWTRETPPPSSRVVWPPFLILRLLLSRSLASPSPGFLFVQPGLLSSQLFLCGSMSQTMDGPAPVKNGNEEDGIAMNE